MYARYVYPQVGAGASHTRPLMPTCFTKLVEVCIGFNVQSADPAQRTEYWEVDELLDTSNVGPLLTMAQLETEVFGVGGYTSYRLANPGP